jgi:2-dehydropantoate 2-reductase
MKIGILGAGAIGSLLGARLAAGGSDVTFIDLPERLTALRQQGLSVAAPDGGMLRLESPKLAARGEPLTLDVLVLAVKAYDVGACLSALPPVIGNRTSILTLQNGIPWWYFQRHRGALAGTTLRTVDPDGAIGGSIDPRRLIGCVAYPAASLRPDGVVEHVEGQRLPIGELDGSTSPRIQALSEALTAAGFRAPVLEDIRSEIWLKALGSLSVNPVSALTGATMAGICREPATREIIATMMQEAQAIAAALGVRLRVSLEQRLRGAERVGNHRTSMLQDLRHGRKLELDALVGAVLEIGDLLGLDAPLTRHVLALTRLLEVNRRTEGGAV